MFELVLKCSMACVGAHATAGTDEERTREVLGHTHERPHRLTEQPEALLAAPVYTSAPMMETKKKEEK